ncbi:UDP-glucose 4-epimerase [Rhizobiales bacterium GAS191]|nr:UDP-glucose 4-epimerase [Rhizobiales bacterium GAS113]SEE85551.1 UDP-glucose 4-epimerase [Rhizobiales bacterium GAS191]
MGYDNLKVLVTGADGFIGSHLTEKLVARGAKVTALCLYNSFDHHGWLDDLPAAARAKLTIVRGDIRDSAFVRRIVQGQDILFHLAALIAIPHSYAAAQSYVETNILGTLNMLEAARESDVVRFVHTSTSEVYGTAITMPIAESHPLQGQSPYSASKIGADMMAESFARSFDLPVAILRPFNTFGPRQSERAVIPTIIRQALDPSCSAIRIGDPTTVRDFTFVDDTAEAFLAIGIAPQVQFGRPYNAGSGKAVTIRELVDLILNLTNCEYPIEHDLQRMRPVNSEVRALLADSRRLTEDTGWRPSVELSEGLERTISWWRGRLAGGLVRRQKEFIT